MLDLNLKNGWPKFLHAVKEIDKLALKLTIKQTTKLRKLKKRKRIVKSDLKKVLKIKDILTKNR